MHQTTVHFIRTDLQTRVTTLVIKFYIYYFSRWFQRPPIICLGISMVLFTGRCHSSNQQHQSSKTKVNRQL